MRQRGLYGVFIWMVTTRYKFEAFTNELLMKLRQLTLAHLRSLCHSSRSHHRRSYQILEIIKSQNEKKVCER